MRILFIFILAVISNYSYSQEYNEEQTLMELDSFISNPKLYYDKIKALQDKIEESNKNLLDVSEEYIGILDKKDSIIKLYKSSNAKLQSESKDESPKVAKTEAKKAPVVADVNYEDKYRVQISSFTKSDFQKFFEASKKFFGIEDHGDRNAFDIRGFNSAEEAFEFSQKMRKLGFPGAFVTKYDDGKRDFSYDYLVESGLKSPSRLDAINKKYDLEYPDQTPLGYQEILANPGSNKIIPSTDGHSSSSDSDGPSSSVEAASSKPVKRSYSSNPEENELNDAFDKLFNR